MDLWNCKNWQNILNIESVRSGVRLKFDSEIDPEVRRSCKEFLLWLRKKYYFPIRVPIYIKATPKIKSLDGNIAFATFFAPYDHNVEPYIRVAAGDYCNERKNKGKDNALAGILYSIAHELTHYFQWINDVKQTEIGYERQATRYSRNILNEYAETRENP